LEDGEVVEIKHRFTGETIYTFTGDSLRGIDLRWADLTGANLRGANLRGANLRMCIGDGVIIRSGQFPKYHVVSFDDMLTIGCEEYRVHEWRGFSDEKIAEMGDGALEWWRKWKDVVLAFADCS